MGAKSMIRAAWMLVTLAAVSTCGPSGPDPGDWARRVEARRVAASAQAHRGELEAAVDTLRGALALLVVFVVCAEAFGAEAILAAFLAGVLLSLLSGRSRQVQAAKLDALGYGFFIPIFFIIVVTRLIRHRR